MRLRVGRMVRRVEHKASVHESCTERERGTGRATPQQDTLLGDKTTNFYNVEPKQYEKLLEENITRDYKKSSNRARNRNKH